MLDFNKNTVNPQWGFLTIKVILLPLDKIVNFPIIAKFSGWSLPKPLGNYRVTTVVFALQLDKFLPGSLEIKLQ